MKEMPLFLHLTKEKIRHRSVKEPEQGHTAVSSRARMQTQVLLW